MSRYILCRRSLTCLSILALALVGCRLDSGRSVGPEGEKEVAGESRPDDGGSIKPRVEKEDAGGSGNIGASGNTLTGAVWDNITSESVADISVVALNNDDLSELGIETRTATDGTFTLEGIIEERICIQVKGTEGEDGRIDTFTCNVPSSQKGRAFLSCRYAIADAIITGLYYGDRVEDSALAKEYGIATISGSVYYKDETGDEFPVDCATVEVAETTDDTGIWYFRSGLPGPAERQTDYSGGFIVAGLAPGRVHLRALADGKTIGSASTTIRAPVFSDSTKDLYTLYIVRIYADQSTDPTPDCSR